METMVRRYYSLAIEETVANIYIYGDIVSWEWLESDVSSYTLAKELETLPEGIDTINVYISSYGGEVKEGLAIYNALKRHKAKVVTVCDGFACSAASVVFMAGDERVMSNASLLMIHNAWFYTAGDANQLRKDAEDLDTITQASVNAYMEHVTITEEELKGMLDDETWITAEDACEMGFATDVINSPSQKTASQHVREKLVNMLLNPSAGIVAKVGVDEEKLREIVQEGIAALKQDLLVEEPAKDPVEPEPETKIKNLMTALFRQN